MKTISVKSLTTFAKANNPDVPVGDTSTAYLHASNFMKVIVILGSNFNFLLLLNWWRLMQLLSKASMGNPHCLADDMLLLQTISLIWDLDQLNLMQMCESDTVRSMIL